MNIRPSLSAVAAAEALMIHAMQKPEEQIAKRALFEEVSYEHYCSRWKGLEPGTYVGEPMPKEQFCQRNPEKPEYYYFSDLNTSWWGFQAGFMAASLQGAKEKK